MPAKSVSYSTIKMDLKFASLLKTYHNDSDAKSTKTCKMRYYHVKAICAAGEI